MQALHMTEKQVNDVTVLKLEGRLDTLTHTTFAEKGLNLLEEGKKAIILDFKDLEYISSGGMRAVLQIFKRAKQLSAKVCIVELSPTVKDILTATGFILFLKTSKDINSAIKEFQS